MVLVDHDSLEQAGASSSVIKCITLKNLGKPHPLVWKICEDVVVDEVGQALWAERQSGVYKANLQTWWAAKKTDPNYDTLKEFDLCHAGIASKEPFARDCGVQVSLSMLRLLLKHEDGVGGAPLRAFQRWAREVLDAHQEADAWERAVLLWDRLCWISTWNEGTFRESLLSLTGRRMDWKDFETAEGEDVNKQTLGEVLGQGGHGVVIRGWGSMGNGQSVPLALKYIVCEGKEVHRRTVALRSAFTEVDMGQAVDSERENLSRAGRDALCLPAAFAYRPLDQNPQALRGDCEILLAYELYDCDLRTYMKEHHGVLAMSTVRRVIRTMLNALMALDQAARGPRDDKGNRIYDGIVHLDIKPTHVLVFRGADQDAATFALADFGIGMRLRVDRYRGGSEQAGTAEYMAPEVREGRSRGVSADIWSLGVMALELIVGEQAMSGPLLSKNLPDHLEIRITRLLDTVDNNHADVKNFVRACLRRNQHHRSTVQELQQILN